MRKILIITALFIITTAAFGDNFNFPQPEISYDMNQVYKQMQEFNEEYKKNGPTKIPQLIYLFSDSVPTVTVENIFKQAKKIHSIEFTGCLRGFKGDTDKDLRAFIEQQVEKGKIDNLEVRLDPFFFRELGVQQVPALVYAECTRYPTKCDYKYIIYGDSKLDYLVEQIYRASKSDKLLEAVLKELRS